MNTLSRLARPRHGYVPSGNITHEDDNNDEDDDNDIAAQQPCSVLRTQQTRSRDPLQLGGCLRSRDRRVRSMSVTDVSASPAQKTTSHLFKKFFNRLHFSLFSILNYLQFTELFHYQFVLSLLLSVIVCILFGCIVVMLWLK